MLASDGMHRVTQSGDATRLFEGAFSLTYPNSMVRDGRGHVFVGMRHSVVELVPGDPLWKARWLVPQDCAHFVLRDDECACSTLPTP